MLATPEMTGPGSANGKRWSLVLSGGGIRFATHVGVVDEMSRWKTIDDEPWLDQFKVLVGTSAGALYAALYAAKYTPAQIALLSELLADRKMSDRLFDKNVHGAGTAYVLYDPSPFLGAVRGESILRLLETIFDRDLSEKVKKDLDQGLLAPRDEGRCKAIRKRLVGYWKEQEQKVRDEGYYRDQQLNFGDASRNGFELYLIATNALTGQKTVFCSVQADRQVDEHDDNALAHSLYLPSPPPATPPNPTPLNQEDQIAKDVARRWIEWTKNKTELDPEFAIDPKRWDQRKHWQFDRGYYGTQLPLALAVRASISIPVIFEPLRLRRYTPEEVEREGRRYEDVFVDGGVDDNLSLSVAADHAFGNSKTIFGVGLSDFGYRVPDPDAIANIASVLIKTMGYVGDAVADFEQVSSQLADCRITVLDALPETAAGLTHTQSVPTLISEGRRIAREFRRVVEPALVFPQVSEASVFANRAGPERLYLSRAARVGPPDVTDVLRLSEHRRPGLLRALWPLPPRWGQWWAFVVPLAVLASIALLAATGIDMVLAWFGKSLGTYRAEALFAAAVVAGLVGIVALRLVALLLAWLRDERTLAPLIRGLVLAAVWAVWRWRFGTYYQDNFGPVGTDFRLLANADFILASLPFLVAAPFIPVALLKWRHIGPTDVGWTFGNFWRNVAIGVASGVAYVLAVIAFTLVFPDSLRNGIHFRFDAVIFGMSLLWGIELAWVEQTLFAGHLQPLFVEGFADDAGRLPPWVVPVAITAAVFAAAHAGWFSTPEGFSGAFLLGLMCSTLRVWTGSLIAPASAHITFWLLFMGLVA